MDNTKNKLADSVNVTVHQSYLTDEVTSYAKVQRQTAYIGNVIDKALEKNGVVDRETLLYVAGILRNAMLELLKAGKAVDLLEMGILYLTAKGSIDGLNPTASDIPPVDLAFTPSALARSAVAGVAVAEPLPENTLPAIKYFVDVDTCKQTDTFTANGSVKVSGQRLKIAGEKSKVGVFFAPQQENGSYDDSGADWIQVDEEHIVQNTATQLLFALPKTLEKGKKYTAIIKTAFGGGKRVNKSVKMYVYERSVSIA